MAAAHEVKRYLAHWLQLGKSIVIQESDQRLAPSRILQGNGYTPEFEALWERVSDPQTGDCYLEGTEQTIQTLLTEQWAIEGCARCSVLVPVCTSGQTQGLSCVCEGMANWPNSETLPPRDPVDSNARLEQLRDRLGSISAITRALTSE
ncbi:hypothetical protein [Leptolyngbya sp. FACHB-261]|uniref:hypothetical protein n=1 Tax=Leptolyngbya sp. FACHB-261 TaxID=2692806 RepID=UPI001689E1BD|nr:hypothetical protein [Leptolyngbya sp. FACHB-261]MBD2101849.1 hypothetical protein [Leptolyngbya sp. FACHB-261]